MMRAHRDGTVLLTTEEEITTMMETDLDSVQDGLLAAFTELLRDPKFYELVGQLATVYGVTVRKVGSIDPRSFRAASEALQRFTARTSGWQSSVSRNTRNGSWRRGAVHPHGQDEERQADVDRLGRRSSRLRSAVEAAADQPPAGSPPPLVASLKSGCPSCGAPHPRRVWRVSTTLYTGVVCPHCVRSRMTARLDKPKEA